MKALVFGKAGDPHKVLHLTDVAEPQIPAGGVLIQVKARPILGCGDAAHDD